jgi:diguanylate cyclase (GGDEF)-like protein
MNVRTRGRAAIATLRKWFARRAKRPRGEADLAAPAAPRVSLDPITGLPGRGLLYEDAGSLLGGMRDGKQGAILVLDIDGFRTLNNSFGHATGNEVLAQVASRLTDAVREGDVVARIGADEFAVVCRRVGGTDEATALARRILAGVAAPFKLPHQRISLLARVGVTVTGPTDRSLADLVHDADLAMTQTRGSRTRWALFRPEMREPVRRLLQTASDLRSARARRELRVEYQPVVELPGGRVRAFEALTRWEHPVRGLVPPSEFIPVAEQSGLISEIGDWVLGQALAAAARWSDQCGDDAPVVTVNVSAQQLADPDFVYSVTRSIGEAGVPPEQLTLEVTESAVMEDVQAAVECLRVLSGVGVRIALDDFGTGASSLSQLRQLHWVDALKIDKSFADGVTATQTDAAIVRTVIELGRTLEMAVVAEGIETPEQAHVMAEMGCAYGQGYHFGRAMHPAAADACVAAGARSRSRLR